MVDDEASNVEHDMQPIPNISWERANCHTNPREEEFETFWVPNTLLEAEKIFKGIVIKTKTF